ncbi:MAG: hypothetical protein AAF236_13060 [Verrucomicrobiota bacterium]
MKSNRDAVHRPTGLSWSWLLVCLVLLGGAISPQAQAQLSTATGITGDSTRESDSEKPTADVPDATDIAAAAVEGTAVAQESGEGEEADPAETDEAAESADAELSGAELREEMLERLADQLSQRMRSLRKREEAVLEREEALSEREKHAADRERALGDLEELMQVREDVIQRREQLPPPQSWFGPDPPSVVGRYAAVIDGETMQFYHKKSADERVPVASTQKLVTALVICRDGGLDELVVVPDIVTSIEPTKIGVQPGERYSRRQLLTSLLVRSGNDIAATLAIDNAGSEEAFVAKMNAFARHLGMYDSNFRNSHGLPAEGQYSTARDIAVAAFEAYQVPEIREIVQLKTYDFVFNSGTVRVLSNTNRVLTTMEGCNGMKTGFTYAAGNCLVSTAGLEEGDRIAVVLKSDRTNVWRDSQRLLEWSFQLEMDGPMPTAQSSGADPRIAAQAR